MANWIDGRGGSLGRGAADIDQGERSLGAITPAQSHMNEQTARYFGYCFLETYIRR